METALAIVAIGLACWFVLRRQTGIIVGLRAELATATVENEKLRVDGQKELDGLESKLDKLDRENESLSVENRLRREFAYVCDECKRHDPGVKETRERTLRSVTKRS